MESISISVKKWNKTIISLSLIIILGLSIRFVYYPFDVPIVIDSFYDFVYASKTVFDNGLPIGYAVTNTGWANFLSFLFLFFDKTNPSQLMDVQRTASIIISTITALPIFFILRRFVGYKWALIGSLLLVVEPRLLLISLEGINYSLFFFLFVLTIIFFLKKTSLSLFLSFVCIAFCAIVRYEGLLLVIPISIMYFIKFRNKKSTLRFLGMVAIMVIIILPIGILRMQATDNYCIEYIFGTVCGQDGITNNILSGPRFFYTYIVLNEQLTESNSKIDDPSIEFHREAYDKQEGLNILKVINESFSRLAKFLGLSLIPYFGFFIAFNVISRIKNWKGFGLNFDSILILSCTGIMLLPALYAYTRGIDEIRYVLVALPLFCIISLSWNKSVSEKILKNRSIIVILIVLILISSITFIEFNKRDSIHDKESFLISQKIVELTSVTNAFHQSGYVKTAVLISDWPILPETGDTGKIVHNFQKIPTKNHHDLAEFISDSKKYGLKYLIIDKDNELFNDLRKNPEVYPYLNKIFDSNNFDFENKFMIYEINYKLFYDNDK